MICPLLPAEDDEDLVRRARAGDERAFVTLYRRNVRYVARTVFSILRRDADVDDVVQRAFADACFQLETLRDARGFRAWVTRIAVRDAWDQLRARRRRRLLADALEWVLPRSTSPREASAVDALYEVLERLPPKLRVPWTLHCMDGFTFEEVASTCAIGLNTAKRRVAEAQARVDRSFHD